MSESAYVIRTDGASRGNPGPAGIAYLIEDADGQVVRSHSEYIGETTSNVAEYRALIAAMTAAMELGATRIRVLSDSDLMVKQLTGVYNVKSEMLATLHANAKTLAKSFRATIAHVPREKNVAADKLASEAIDRYFEQNPPTSDDSPKKKPPKPPAASIPVAPPDGFRASPDTTYVIHTDGASQGNPGNAGIGFTISDDKGALICSHSEFIGQETNNVAEYRALIAALDQSLALGVRRVEVVADSQLMVKQLNGEFRVKNESLLPLFQEAQSMARAFESFEARHVLRNENKAADALATGSIKAYRRAQKEKAQL
ncbi:MAG: ribonuclease HI family protein [Candidatus Poribacteria bacterium]|nr:ribonuclease HI family protein [Candidatus Poribacteria bacterium]